VKAPFRVLFSNDTTNITTCVSPFHKKREPFRPEMIEATVDETAGTGIQVHLLQPGLGWIPWWKSKEYPGDEHYRWFERKTGIKPDSFGQYMLAGGDLVEVFVRRCRLRGLTPFVSLRLNDGHHLRSFGTKKPATTGASRFYEEHVEQRIGPNLKDWSQGVLNWLYPEVRAHKFAFIKELCEGYDLDGFELDFMRHPSYFQVDKTTTQQRAEIMTGFVSQVRELLDRTSRAGQRRWLCVRVPCFVSVHDSLGLDLPAMVKAGVDMVNVSPHYWTVQQTDFAVIRKMVPDAAVYLEMTHTTGRITPQPESPWGDFALRLTTPEQFYTTAHLAYARGADGVSAFNFVYYREGETPHLGEANNPPFYVFKRLGDPAWLSQQPQHYILGNANVPNAPKTQIPQNAAPGGKAIFTLDMAPPQGGWKTAGRLRIQGRQVLGAGRWNARLNGVELHGNMDVSEPYKNPYPFGLGTPQTLRVWVVPPGLLKNGLNTIEIVMAEGKPVTLEFLDLAVA
jgi:hypothetical protein